MNNEDKICFVMIPIGEPDSSVTDRSNKLMKLIVRPVAEKCGYNVVQSDELLNPDSITTQVIEHIFKDSIVLADLSDHNPNIYYELAIRHIIKKPFIQLIEIGQKNPFEMMPIKTIYYNHRDMESVDKVKDEIKRQIRFVEQNFDKIESPISYSINISTLSTSQNSMDKDITSIIHQLQNLQTEISHLNDNVRKELNMMKDASKTLEESYREKKLDTKKIIKK